MQRILLAVSCLMLSACATSYELPGLKYFTPETEGEKGSVQIGLGQFYNVTITTDTPTVLVSNSSHNVEPRTSLNLSGAYGALPWLDVGMAYDTASLPIYYAKAQFLGANKRAADEGNLSGSVILGVSPGESYNKTLSDSVIFPTGSGTINYRTDIGFDLGFQFGYRPAKQTLLTLGFNGFWQNISGNHTLSTGPSTSFTERSRLVEINAGAIVYADEDSTVFIYPLLQYGQITSFSSDQYRFTYGLTLGYQF